MSGFRKKGERLIQQFLRVLTLLLVAVTALPVHEYAHALAADHFGDHTARDAGRLTLNPLVHLDFLGTLALLIFGFGWAKPTPVRVENLRRGKRHMALVALAGPAANVLLAFVLMVIFKVYLCFADISAPVGLTFSQVLYSMLDTNLYLAVFNLLPIPPLDGSRIVDALLPFNIRNRFMKFEKFFMLALVLLLYLGILQVPLNYLSEMLFSGLNWATAPVDFLLRLIGG